MHAVNRFSTVVLDQQRLTAAEMKAGWRAGVQPSARSAIDNLGGIDAVHKSIQLDLAYEEYCLRRENGEHLIAADFVAQFSQISRTLRRQIEIHNALSERGVLGDPEDLPEWPEPGDEIGGFLLLEQLGQGTFGRVFRASEISLKERPVVVKVARHGHHEAQLLAQVAHRNIVPVYSASLDPEWGLTVLCMPFSSRATLLDVVELVHRSGHVPSSGSDIASAAASVNCEDETLTLNSSGAAQHATFGDAVAAFGLQIAEALVSTHEQGICHRDLKPSNILVSQTGEPLLIDFNLSSEPVKGMPLGGTLPYMAPEQLNGFVKLSDGHSTELPGPTADIFSLGVCLFELLHGQHPFGPVPTELSTRDLAAHLYEAQQSGPCRVPESEALLDNRLKSVLARCLEANPDHRIATAEELVAELSACLSRGSRLRRLWRANRRLARITGTTLLVSLTCALVWFLTQPNPRDLQRKRASQAMVAEQWAEATELLTGLLDESDETELHLMRGNALLKQNRFQGALDDYLEVRRHRPDESVDSRIAYCHMKLNHYDVAADIYQDLLSSHPESATLHNNLGYAYLQDSLFEPAITHFSKAIELNDHSGTAWLNRADARFQQALALRQPTPPEAIEDMKKGGPHMMQTGESALFFCRALCSRPIIDVDELRKSLHLAVTNGVSKRLLLSDTALRSEILKDEYRDLIERAGQDARMTRSVRIVPPW